MLVFRIVILHPFGCECSYLVQVIEPICIKDVFTVESVQSFHQCVLYGPARLYEPEFDMFSFAPFTQGLGYELWPVVATYGFWKPYFLFQMAKGLHNLFGRVAQPHIHCQGFTVAIVHNVEHPDLPSIREYVGHKVHTPDVVQFRWDAQRILCPCGQTFFVLSAQFQVHRPIDTQDTFSVPWEAFATQPFVIYLEAPCRKLFCKSCQGINYLGVVLFGMVVPQRTGKLQNPTGTGHAYRVGLLKIFGTVLLVGRP